MKPNMRWQLLFAFTGFGLVLALLSYHIQYESRLCTERFATSGGVFTEGVLGAPLHINPLLAGNNPVDRQLVDLIFDGLTTYEDGELVPALAESWSISEDGRTVRFKLRDDVTWHDGQPFTAEDVAYTYSLIQDEAFTGDGALQRLWESVVIRVVSPQEIEFELREPYAGFLEATTMGILPAHLLENVAAEALAEAPFNRSPVGTGPFQVEPGQDWEASGQLLLTPFAAAWPQGVRIGSLGFYFFQSREALLEAYRQGAIQAINDVTPIMLPQVIQLPDVRLFSAPASRYSTLLFNTSPDASTATQSREVRKALALALDRELIVDEALSGQGIVQTGPYLPSSWAYQPAALTIAAGNPVSATLGLEAAGWIVPEGSDVRENGGERLILRFLVYDTPTNRALAAAVETELEQAGAAPLLSLFSDWRDYRRALADGEFDLALVDVDAPGDPDLYDFWSQEAIIRGQNYAGWNRRRASEALEDGRRAWTVAERKPFYEAFLRLYSEDLPEVTLFQHIYTYAVRDSIEGVEIGRIDDTRDRYASLASWIVAYENLAVLCPEDRT
ncbi:MAG: ABC transporter substrate-binding protein [Candidatus Promineifilaceae bacterium]